MFTKRDGTESESTIDLDASQKDRRDPDPQDPHAMRAPSAKSLEEKGKRDAGPPEAKPAGDAPEREDATEEPGKDAAEEVVEVILEPSQKKPVRRRKKKPAKKDDRRKPTEQEVLQRLLEKNEVIVQLSKRNIELEAQLKSLAKKRVQLMAEFENYRKRTRKEWDLLKDQAKVEVIGEFLNVVDDFERALAAFGDQEDEFVQGVRLIYNNMLSTLEKFGVRKLVALGQTFDPNFHMAVAQIDSEATESGHVVEVIQEGYLMDGAVIRPANVVIAK